MKALLCSFAVLALGHIAVASSLRDEDKEFEAVEEIKQSGPQYDQTKKDPALTPDQREQKLGEIDQNVNRNLSRFPDSSKVQNEGAEFFYRRKGDYREGLERSARAIAAAEARGERGLKDLSQALTTRGNAYQKMGGHPHAAADCFKALEADPGNRTAYACYQLNKNRAPAADRTKAPEPAVPAVVGAPAQAPVAPAAAPGLADADALKAATLIREGRVKLGLGDKRTAVEHGERAGAADPGNAKALVLQSLAYHALKLYEAALTAARAAAALDPDDAEAWAAMAEAKHALGYALEDVLHDAGKAARLDQAFRRRFEEIAAQASGRSATIPKEQI